MATSTSGLRPGFVRETKPELKRPLGKTSEKEKAALSEKTKLIKILRTIC